MNCISDNKEEIYLTTSNASIQTDDIIDNDFFFPNLSINTQRINKINLPLITNHLIKSKIYNSYYNSLNYEFEKIKPHISYVNSNSITDNYIEFQDEPLEKEKFNPKKILLKNRKYNCHEKNLISTIIKDEMKHRSPGQGMFIKIQKYNQYNKIKPFKLFYSKNDLNNKNTRRFDKNIIIRNNKLKLPFYFQTSKDKMNDLSNLNNKNKTQKILKPLKN
jgi:hypothetical protein